MAALSLADLESFDPGARETAGRRRFCCPLCGDQKQRDREHQSLALDPKSGAWRCWRCQATGKITDRWEDRQPQSRRERSRMQARRVFALPPPPPPEPADDGDWRKHLAGLVPIAGTPGEVYLQGRGISLGVAAAAGVRFHARWYGQPAVAFPVRGTDGELVAAQGRYLEKDATPKTRSAGRIGRGVFSGMPDALNGALVALVEGPACALTLAGLGLPAAAVMGRALPTWLALRLFGKRVFIATDADGPGDESAAAWAVTLRAYGATVSRLRPPGGAKDWNAAAQANPEGLAAFVTAALLGEEPRDTWEDDAPAVARAPVAEPQPEADPENDELLDAVAVAGLMVEEPAKPGSDVWPDFLHPAVLWALGWEPQPSVERVRIAGGVYVTDQVRFAASLRAEVLAGPERDRLGAVKARLRGAYQAFGCPA